MNPRKINHRKLHRRGALFTLELILVLPVMLGLLFALVEFGLLWEGNQRVKLASEAGARVASMPGPITQSDIDNAVVAVLHKPAIITNHVTTKLGGASPGDPITVEVTVPAVDAVPDLLGFLGFSLGGASLYGQTTLLKQ